MCQRLPDRDTEPVLVRLLEREFGIEQIVRGGGVRETRVDDALRGGFISAGPQRLLLLIDVGRVIHPRRVAPLLPNVVLRPFDRLRELLIRDRPRTTHRAGHTLHLVTPRRTAALPG